MNPLLQSALLAILRWALTIASGWFVRKGIWTDANAAEYVTAGAVALVTVGWSVWNKINWHIKFNTALAMPKGSTPDEVTKTIDNKMGASATTGSDVSPRLNDGK